MDELPSRVAVLEQIAQQTLAALVEIRGDLRESRQEMRAELHGLRDEIRGVRDEVGREIRGLRSETRSDFRWLMGLYVAAAAALLGVMAHGFHWL